MAALSLVRDDDAIGFSNKPVVLPTLVPYAVDPDSLISTLIQKTADLEVLVEGKVTKGEVKTEIAFGSELIKIQAKEVAVVGDFTVIDILNEQNGTTTGQISTTITRIIGDLIQTGAIISNNFSPSAGTAIDLDNATIIMGGSSSPKFDFDGVNLTIEGSITAGSIYAGDINTSGTVLATGATTSGGENAAIIAQPVSTSFDGVVGDLPAGSVVRSGVTGRATTSGNGVRGLATSATGVLAAVTLVAGQGLSVVNTGGGTAINLGSDVITGDATFEDDVVIERTLQVDLTSTFVGKASFNGAMDLGNSSGDVITINGTPTFNTNVVITGNSDLDVDRSTHFASDGQSGDSSVRIGVSAGHGDPTITGHNTLVIAETTGGGGALTAGQIQVFADESSDSKSTLGLISEQTVAAIGTFTPSHKYKIFINAVEYEIQLDQV